MAEDEYSTEMELYGVSPTIITYIIIPITLVIPFCYIPDNFGVFFFFGHIPGRTVYSTIWEIYFSFSGRPYFTLLSIEEIYSLLPVTISNWLFAYWIVRYYQGKSSRFSVWMIGFISVLFPFLGSLYTSGLVGDTAFIIPFPFLFIILIILRRIEGPEVISPWSGMRLDISWWKWRRAKRQKQLVKVEDKTQTSQDEDWLEE